MRPRELYLKFKGLRGLKRTEMEDGSRISRSLTRRLWLWRRGFISRSDVLYDLSEGTYREYVSDYQRFVHTRLINGTWSIALKNKLMFHWMMQPSAKHRMTVHGILRDGGFHPIDLVQAPRMPVGGPPRDTEQVIGTRPYDRSWVIEALEDRSLILKWIQGGGGNNVLVCHRTDNTFLVNGEPMDRAAFDNRLGELDDYLVCEFVEQGSISATLYPETPNTLRIITMYDSEAGEAFIPAAIHRIGTQLSHPMDNFLQGGLSAEIDPVTGELSAAAQLPIDGQLTWHPSHPDTGTSIEGRTIPGWQQIRSKILELADLHWYLPYVGWDLILTDDEAGFKVIEANSYPGLHSIQVHRPLLADDRTRRFYEAHEVV